MVGTTLRSLGGSTWGVAVVLGAIACGGGGSTPMGDGSSGSGSDDTGPVVTGDSTQGPLTTGPDATDTGTTTPGATEGTTVGTADETSTGEPGLCQDEPMGGEACQPPGPATIGWQVRLDGVELLDQEIMGACTVTSVVDDGVVVTVALDCARFEVEIDLITVSPHHVPALQPDDPVELRASAYFEDEAVVARYLTLRRGGLALAAFDASEFDPPAGFDFDPVAIAVVASDCPSQATECVYKQDAALQVGFDGQTALLFQGHEGFVGQLTSYQVIAGQVERIFCFPDDCGYNYAEWFVQGLVFRIPEG